MWQTIERTHSILGIIASLIAVLGLLSATSAIWLKFTVPGWLGILLFGASFALGWFSGALYSRFSSARSKGRSGIAVSRIGFDYNDNPVNHGWRVSHDAPNEPEAVTFQHGKDSKFGSYLAIDASARVRLDYDLEPACQIADAFEISFRPTATSVFYARLRASGVQGAHIPCWICCKLGHSAPERLDRNEWTVYTQPVEVHGDWVRVHYDIGDQFKKTFGLEGMTLDQLSGFRLRGSMSIASITLCAQRPNNPAARSRTIGEFPS